MKRLQLDAAAWQKGFDTGDAGQPVSECPYANDSIEAWSWSSGFVEGKAARMQRVSSGQRETPLADKSTARARRR
jgi:ribosome modulation factor